MDPVVELLFLGRTFDDFLLRPREGAVGSRSGVWEL